MDEDVLGAWALGALDAEEEELVVAALAADRDLDERAAQMEEVVAVMGSALPVAPPAAMRDRVLAALDDLPQVSAPPDAPVDAAPADAAPVDAGTADGASTAGGAAGLAALPPQVSAAPRPAAREAHGDSGVQPGGTTPARDAEPAGARRADAAPVGDLDAARRRPGRRAVLRGLALAASGAVVGAAGVGTWLATRPDPESFAAVRERVEAAPDVRTVAASDATGAWAATELRYSDSVGEAVVVASSDLPAPDGGVYQLWRQADPEGAPTPLTTFEGGGGVVVAGGLAGAAAVAVSREGAPGATEPTTPVLVHYYPSA